MSVDDIDKWQHQIELLFNYVGLVNDTHFFFGAIFLTFLFFLIKSSKLKSILLMVISWWSWDKG